jgi:hypothetical protein
MARLEVFEVLEDRLRREYDPRLPFVKDFYAWVESQQADFRGQLDAMRKEGV